MRALVSCLRCGGEAKAGGPCADCVAADKKDRDGVDGYEPHAVAAHHRQAIANFEANARAIETSARSDEDKRADLVWTNKRLAGHRECLAKAEKDADLLDRFCDHFRGDE